MTRRRRVAATWATALVLAGCGAPDGSAGSYGAPNTAPAAGISSYVALGDSYVSGPGIDEPVAAAGYCLRSTRNYPALLAADLAIDDVTDVSCGGATTAGVLAPSTVQQLPVPAQLDAVAPDSDLVTIGIGGNDDGLTTSLFVSCLIPASRDAAACGGLVPATSPPTYPAIEDRIVRTVDAVRAKAPAARVVLVGYLTIVGGAGACAPLDLDADEAARAAAVLDALEDTQRAAARRSGAEFVSVRDVSAAHDACHDDAWVNGLTGPPGDGAFLHPRAAGMRAVATTLAEHLRDGAP